VAAHMDPLLVPTYAPFERWVERSGLDMFSFILLVLDEHAEQADELLAARWACLVHGYAYSRLSRARFEEWRADIGRPVQSGAAYLQYESKFRQRYVRALRDYHKLVILYNVRETAMMLYVLTSHTLPP